MAASPLWVSEELEYWDSNIRFTHIAATYSELVAVSTQGQLHQWRWADAHPYQRNDVSNSNNYSLQNFLSIYSQHLQCNITFMCRRLVQTRHTTLALTGSAWPQASALSTSVLLEYACRYLLTLGGLLLILTNLLVSLETNL